MWSKGAVVIVKRGDPEMADSIEQSLILPIMRSHEFGLMERENFFLRRRSKEDIQKRIEYAERKYGHKWKPFEKYKWLIIERISSCSSKKKPIVPAVSESFGAGFGWQ